MIAPLSQTVRAVLSVSILASALCVACGGDDPASGDGAGATLPDGTVLVPSDGGGVADRYAVVVDDLTRVLATVRDAATLKAARADMERLGARIKELNAEFAASVTGVALTETLRNARDQAASSLRLGQAQARLSQELMRLAQDPTLGPMIEDLTDALSNAMGSGDPQDP